MNQLREALQNIGRTMITQHLTWGNAGNISARTDENTCLITVSGTRLGELALDDLVEVPLSASVKVDYVRKPSKELPMHRAVYEVRPDVKAVLHAAPLYSTLVACADLEIPAGLFVETMYYLERMARVPYHHPGSQTLGDAVREKASQANVLLLENHGVLVFDTSLAEAMMGLQTLEAACQTMIIARSAGIPLKQLSLEVLQDFLGNAGYKIRRTW
jgi:3-dehydro-4-phosphotetronate decarboxylase